MSHAKTDADTTVQELKDAIIAFRDERGWQLAHSPRNLATSIAVEAAELLEHFQWGDLQERDRRDTTDDEDAYRATRRAHKAKKAGA